MRPRVRSRNDRRSPGLRNEQRHDRKSRDGKDAGKHERGPREMMFRAGRDRLAGEKCSDDRRHRAREATRRPPSRRNRAPAPPTRTTGSGVYRTHRSTREQLRHRERDEEPTGDPGSRLHRDVAELGDEPGQDRSDDPEACGVDQHDRQHERKRAAFDARERMPFEARIARPPISDSVVRSWRLIQSVGPRPLGRRPPCLRPGSGSSKGSTRRARTVRR